MRKIDFFEELKDILMYGDDDLNEDTPINLTSLASLSVVVFLKENFDKQIKGADLKNVSTPRELMTLIGIEKFE